MNLSLNRFDFASGKQSDIYLMRVRSTFRAFKGSARLWRVGASSEETSTSFLGIVPVCTIVHSAQSAIRRFPYLALIVIEFSRSYCRDVRDIRDQPD